VLRTSVAGVARVERKLSRAELEITKGWAQEMQSLSEEALGIFESRVPGGPRGRIGRGLRVHARVRANRVGFELISTTREFGYDPLAVSRFGQRGGAARKIRPREDRAPASVRSTRKRRGSQALRRAGKGQVALRLREHGTGRIIFRHYVRGYRPPSDWVKVAREEMKPVVREATARLGRRIVSGGG
jgi:hypothetical protein